MSRETAYGSPVERVEGGVEVWGEHWSADHARRVAAALEDALRHSEGTRKGRTVDGIRVDSVPSVELRGLGGWSVCGSTEWARALLGHLRAAL